MVYSDYRDEEVIGNKTYATVTVMKRLFWFKLKKPVRIVRETYLNLKLYGAWFSLDGSYIDDKAICGLIDGQGSITNE